MTSWPGRVWGRLCRRPFRLPPLSARPTMNPSRLLHIRGPARPGREARRGRREGAAMSTTAEPSPAPGVPCPSGYEVLGELGRGGMGVVYKARQTKQDRLVALKVMRTGRGAPFLELARFRVDAEAVAGLDHPNIARLHEVGVCAGYPYLAVEFAPGGSLAPR